MKVGEFERENDQQEVKKIVRMVKETRKKNRETRQLGKLEEIGEKES
jgi:hypothetical protein